MRILGIDYGERKVGVALGDTETRIASPWMILDNQGHGELIKQIKLVVENEGVERVVIGIPRDTRDLSQDSKQADAVRIFIFDLRTSNIPVDEVNEMLTTAEAQHSMHASGSRAEDDAVAAAIILQSYLDKITNGK
jgi:putative Holliday junction resolvase